MCCCHDQLSAVLSAIVLWDATTVLVPARLSIFRLLVVAADDRVRGANARLCCVGVVGTNRCCVLHPAFVVVV